jgi:hypothetical protein
MRIWMIEILAPEEAVIAPSLLEFPQKASVSIGPIVEKRTFVKRHDARVISGFVTDEEPRVETKFQKPF